MTTKYDNKDDGHIVNYTIVEAVRRNIDVKSKKSSMVRGLFLGIDTQYSVDFLVLTSTGKNIISLNKDAYYISLIEFSNTKFKKVALFSSNIIDQIDADEVLNNILDNYKKNYKMFADSKLAAVSRLSGYNLDCDLQKEIYNQRVTELSNMKKDTENTYNNSSYNQKDKNENSTYFHGKKKDKARFFTRKTEKPSSVELSSIEEMVNNLTLNKIKPKTIDKTTHTSKAAGYTSMSETDFCNFGICVLCGVNSLLNWSRKCYTCTQGDSYNRKAIMYDKDADNDRFMNNIISKNMYMDRK